MQFSAPIKLNRAQQSVGWGIRSAIGRGLRFIVVRLQHSDEREKKKQLGITSV